MAQLVETKQAESAAANPAVLGLSAFALTTFVLSSANAGIFSAPEIVTGLALFYGGFIQVLAGLQEFKVGNTFGATVFCSYGGFWLAVGVIFTPAFNVIAPYATGKDFNIALGYFLLGWTIFTALMFLAVLRTNVTLVLIFAALLATFITLTMGTMNGSTSLTHTAGWLGIVTAGGAWYAALANLLASSKSAFKLPLGRIG